MYIIKLMNAKCMLIVALFVNFSCIQVYPPDGQGNTLHYFLLYITSARWTGHHTYFYVGHCTVINRSSDRYMID